MKLKTLIMLMIASITAWAVTPEDNIQNILNKHYAEYKDKEYFSGLALSVLVPGNPIKNYYVGTVSHQKNSAKISQDTLFQIGSITKSFTAAVLLQAARDGQLRINDTLGEWLPEYANWSSMPLTKLINMTSGLPNYTDAPLWYSAETNDFNRVWTPSELINFVYLKKYAVPIKPGYFYTNTGYALTDLILEKATKTPFKTLMQKIITKADLKNTFYPVPEVDKTLVSRLASGYNYNQYDNPAIVGEDLRLNNLSWAGAAGGMISTPEDIIKWVNAIFKGENVLTPTQKNELMQLNSTNTAKPIPHTSKENPEGFGLGVASMYRENMGPIWFYEGITLGFRALYIYNPCNGITISAIANSTTSKDNDTIGKLTEEVYNDILKGNSKLQCN